MKHAYYINHTRLCKFGACDRGLATWFNTFGNKNVPLSIDTIAKYIEQAGQLKGVLDWRWLHASLIGAIISKLHQHRVILRVYAYEISYGIGGWTHEITPKMIYNAFVALIKKAESLGWQPPTA